MNERRETSERKVHISKSGTNLINEDFERLRERMDNEMKRIEERFDEQRKKFTEADRDFFGKSSLSSSHERNETRTTSSTSHSSSNLSSRPSYFDDMKSWMDDMDNSPLIRKTDDGHVFKLTFDLNEYAPEEIAVKTIDNLLQVSAEHKEESENRNVSRKFKREFLLPKGVDPEKISSTLSKDNILTVEAHIPAIEGNERRVPISHK